MRVGYSARQVGCAQLGKIHQALVSLHTFHDFQLRVDIACFSVTRWRELTSARFLVVRGFRRLGIALAQVDYCTLFNGAWTLHDLVLLCPYVPVIAFGQPWSCVIQQRPFLRARVQAKI